MATNPLFPLLSRAEEIPPACSPIAECPADKSLELNLNQALDLGMRQSLSLQRGELTVKEAQDLKRLAKARFLPKLDLLSVGTFAQVGTNIGFISNLPVMGDLNLALASGGYAVVRNTFANLGLALNVPVIDFGRNPIKKAAQSAELAADASLREQQRRIRFEITTAYLNAQLSAAMIPVWMRSLAFSKSLLRDTLAIRRVGLAARVDTLQAQALVATDNFGLNEAVAQNLTARSALARALNLPPKTQVRTSEPLQLVKAWPLSFDESLSRSIKNRPLLDAIASKTKIQLAKVAEAKSESLPKVGLLLGAGINGDWLSVPVLNQRMTINGAGAIAPSGNASGSASGQFYDWGAVLSFRQPLFDGGLAKQSAALAQHRAEQSDLELQEAKQAITQSVVTWFNNYRSSQLQLQSANAAVKAGHQALRDGLLRYRAGIAPLTELLLIQRNLQVAEGAYNTAIHRYNIARFGLEFETGILDQ